MQDYDDLHQRALNFWPIEIDEAEKKASVIPKLLETQDKFISLLNLSDKDPFAWKNILNSSKELSPNLFLKHLIVLSDVGGERLERFQAELQNIYTNSEMEFIWNENKYKYCFLTLFEGKSWNNKNLFVDGMSINKPQPLLPVIEDVIMLLMFSGSAIDDTLPQEIVDKCIIGTLLGKNDELESFVRQRYIWVSRITGGATANTLGQMAQLYVIEKLKKELSKWDFTSKSIPGISQNDGRTPMKFDIVACSPNKKFCAIEVSFQVTTNSTIERKAGQARSRHSQIKRKGHSIAYIIDGAGNFKRKSAISTIISYSDLTVTFKEEELEKLIIYLKLLDS